MAKEIDNPWAELLSESSYILAADKEDVDRFNNAPKRSLKHKIITDLMPEPYLGNPWNASVILLNLNPGYDAKDYDFYGQAAVRQAALDNLLHKRSSYPFFMLDQMFEWGSGPGWWRSKLNNLICDVCLEKVAQNVCCIEYFPYHSERFGAVGMVKSQEYTFHLVRQAVAMNKIILIMRSQRRWKSAVETLENHNCYYLKSPQGAWITSKNITDDGYSAIVKAISR